jgi:hypothetical protein
MMFFSIAGFLFCLIGICACRARDPQWLAYSCGGVVLSLIGLIV